MVLARRRESRPGAEKSKCSVSMWLQTALLVERVVSDGLNEVRETR